MAGEPSNHDPDAFWTASLDEAAGKLVRHIRAFRPHVVVTYDANGAYGHPDHIQAHRATLIAVEAAYQPKLYPDAGEPWHITKMYYTAFPASAARKVVELAQQFGTASPFGDTPPEELDFVTRDELVTTTVDCGEQIVRKQQALRAHHSQITDDFPLLLMPAEMVREHFPYEHFQLVWSHVPTRMPETDLFAGLGD
jgi:LmbE family N-acetylglucosaminyl deacetylase